MLEMEHVKKRYGDFLLDASLHVRAGMVSALVGPNGAGKSTLFKTALGLVRPDEGAIRMFGSEVPERQRLGVVLSDSGFSGYLRVKDVRAILSRMYPRFDDERFIRLCHSFQIPMNKRINSFSTGMKAKLKVICAITHHAELLILDEPTAGLDVIARDELLDLLRDFMGEDDQRSIIISSHIATDLESLCDDLYLIDEGKILLHEDTDVLLSDYALLKMSEEQFAKVDRSYLLRVRREPYGYCALCAQKQYYAENDPQIVIQNSGIDDLITMMIRGEKR